MKQPMRIRKLAVQRETIRVLTRRHLLDIVGAGDHTSDDGHCVVQAVVLTPNH